MLISIIIPIYNVSKYIENCISSVCAQTMTDGVECILVDDCSPDNSIELAKKVIAQYTGKIKFNIVNHTENEGTSAARNTGIRHATGDYIYFMDDDDYITHDCLQTLWALVNKYPNVDIVKSATKNYANGLNTTLNMPWVPEYSQDKKWLRFVLQRARVQMHVWNMLIKRKFITDNNIYFMEGTLVEDWHWTFFAGRHIHTMAFCKHITYTHIKNPTAQSYNNGITIDNYITVINDMIERIDISAIRLEMRYILTFSYDMGKGFSVMGGNLFRANWLYYKTYFRKLYDNYSYINRHGRKSFRGLWAYLLYEMYLVYTCQQIAKHQKLIHRG